MNPEIECSSRQSIPRVLYIRRIRANREGFAKIKVELQIDTSTRYASVGISSDGASIVEIGWRSERNHSMELVPAINRAFAQARRGVEDLDSVLVASGPGGFSALRVGMSTAKAIASTRSIPLVAVGTLDLEIEPFEGMGARVCALISAGRNRLYVGVKDPADTVVKVDLQQTAEFLGGLSPSTIYCGEAAPDLAAEMSARLGGSFRASLSAPPSRRASALARLGYRKLQAGETADPATVEPLYLRSSQVSAAARRWGVRQ